MYCVSAVVVKSVSVCMVLGIAIELHGKKRCLTRVPTNGYMTSHSMDGNVIIHV